MVVFAFTNVCTHVPEKKKLEHNSVQQPPCSTCGETYARDNLYTSSRAGQADRQAFDLRLQFVGGEVRTVPLVVVAFASAPFGGVVGVWAFSLARSALASEPCCKQTGYVHNKIVDVRIISDAWHTTTPSCNCHM